MDELKMAVALKVNTDFSITVQYDDGEIRKLDMEKMVSKYPKYFLPLKKDRQLFESAHLSPLGRGIIWTDEIDLDVVMPWYHGDPVAEF